MLWREAYLEPMDGHTSLPCWPFTTIDWMVTFLKTLLKCPGYHFFLRIWMTWKGQFRNWTSRMIALMTCLGLIIPVVASQIALWVDGKKYCPKSCDLCNTSSSRGPVLLVHKNRLSCSLPEEVTQWPTEIRSISLIGNNLGNGSRDLPPWIHKDEQQLFLYVSSNTALDICLKMIYYAYIFMACMFFLLVRTETSHIRHVLDSFVTPQLTRNSHKYLLQMSTLLSPFGVALFCLYSMRREYYGNACRHADGFSSTTLSHFSNPSHGNPVAEWFVAIMWAGWVTLVAFFVRTPNRPEREVRYTRFSERWCLTLLQKLVYSLFWLCVVTILASPSVIYALAVTGSIQLPADKTSIHSILDRKWWSNVGNETLHYQVSLIMVLVDMFITPKLVAIYSARTGLCRFWLFMAARLVTMWLAATLTTLYLSTDCMNGWTHTWKVCNTKSKDYADFNISFGDMQILEPTADLCSASESLWGGEGKCMRELVNTMAPLLVSKMITRAFLQPIFTFLRWAVSLYHDGQLYFRIRRYFLCGPPTTCWICTSNSLQGGQQVSLLVTFAEMAFLWGPFVPLLLPVVILATCTNMLMCQIGHGHFGVEHSPCDTDPTFMACRYLHGTLVVLIFFQNWFAWSSEMHGKWLLLLIGAGLLMMEVYSLGIRNSSASASWRHRLMRFDGIGCEGRRQLLRTQP